MADELSKKLEDNLYLADAVAFANQKHREEMRKGSSLPYITHVVEAMEIVSRLTEDREVRAAAVLHDTVEDTETTLEDLRERFGDRVAQLVAHESEDKREGLDPRETWKTRKEETIRHLAEADTEARMIALGDKLSNIRAIARDYEILGSHLWERFNMDDPAKHSWYYSSLADVFAGDDRIRNTSAYREYRRLVDRIFEKYTDAGQQPEDE